MSHIRSIASLSFLLLVCSYNSSDATGLSSEPMTLSFEPTTMSRVGVRTAEGNLRCEVDLIIRARGNSDHILTLGNISASFTIAGVSNSPAIISPRTWFNVSSLKRDETAVTRRIPTAASPFTFISTMAYTDQFGTSKTTTSTLTCTD